MVLLRSERVVSGGPQTIIVAAAPAPMAAPAVISNNIGGGGDVAALALAKEAAAERADRAEVLTFPPPSPLPNDSAPAIENRAAPE